MKKLLITMMLTMTSIVSYSSTDFVQNSSVKGVFVDSGTSLSACSGTLYELNKHLLAGSLSFHVAGKTYVMNKPYKVISMVKSGGSFCLLVEKI